MTTRLEVTIASGDPELGATLADIDRMPTGPDRDEMIGVTLIAVGQLYLRDAAETRGWRRASEARRGGKRVPSQ